MLRRGWLVMLAAFLLLAVTACGGAESVEPVIVEKEIVKEVEKPVVVEKEVIKEVEKEVIKEVEKPVIVEKVVIKEVIKEVQIAPVGKPWEAYLEKGKHGGILKAAMHRDAVKWDLHQSCCAGDPGTVRDLYSNLVMYDPTNQTEIIGDIAKSWEWAPDGMSVTFRLWENAKWWDGEPVTADDVIFSLDRMAETGKARPRVKNIRPYYQNAEAIGPYTVKVNTKDPSPPAFLAMLGIGYMTMHPKHVLEGKPEDYFAIQENIVAAGAYKYVSYEPGVKLEFRKNPDFFKDGLPFLDGVDTFIIKGKDRMVAALETEQVMITKIFGVFTRKDGPTVEPRLTKIGRVVWWGPEMLSSLYHMNWTKAPFDDPKVRRAMYLATDRKHLIDVVELGTAVMPTPFFPGSAWASSDEEIATWPGFRYVDEAGKPFLGNPIGVSGLVKDPSDLEEARRLMAEAGYADGFKTTAVATQQAADEEVAQVLKEDLQKIGVDINIQVRPDFASSIAAEQGGDYEMIVLGHGPNIIDPDDLFLGLYLAGGPRNPLKYENPRIREIFEEQKVEADPSKRQALILEAEEIVRQGEGHIVLNFWSGRVAWVVNDKVKNWFPSKTIQYGFGTQHMWLEE